jgi:hypothetical protein
MLSLLGTYCAGNKALTIRSADDIAGRGEGMFSIQVIDSEAQIVLPVHLSFTATQEERQISFNLYGCIHFPIALHIGAAGAMDNHSNASIELQGGLSSADGLMDLKGKYLRRPDVFASQ